MPKIKDKFLDWMDRAEIPEEAVLSVPTVQLIGFCRISLEPQDGLLEYARERVVVAVPEGSVSICGTGLEIVLMKEKRLELRGQITEIKLEQAP